MELVVRFLQTRQMLSNMWSTMSSGIIEKGTTVNSIISNNSNNNSSLISNYPLVNIQDIYSTAIAAKVAWDSMMRALAKRMKIESRSDEEGWHWFNEKLRTIETQSLDSSYDYNYTTAEGLITVPIKDKDAALKKASRDYHQYTISSAGGPSICHVTDWVRCSIVCASEEKICDILSAMKVSTNMRILQIKNRFTQPTPVGYRDVIVKVSISVERDDDSKNRSSSTGGSEKAVDQFICELQIHHLEMYKVGVREDLYFFYKYFYSYFKDCFHDAKVITDRIKVLKKMDQISNDVSELDNFIRDFLTSNSRASRDITRLHALFSILKLVQETDLAEAVQMSIIQQYRAKNMRKELSDALSKLSAHLKGRHKYEQALPLSEEALQICEDDHGFLYEDTAVQNMNLGTLCSCLGNYQRALTHFDNANTIYATILGANHGKTIEALNFIAIVYQDIQDWSLAADRFNDLLNRKLEVYGFYHLEVAEAVRSVAYIDEVRGLLTTAIQMHEASLKIYERIFGDQHHLVAEAYTSIGLLYDRQGRLFDALKTHKTALKIRQRVLPPDHEATAESLNNIGMIYIDIGEFEEALPLLESALEIRVKVFEPNNPRHVLVAESKNNLGEALMHRNRSMECIQRAKGLFEDAYAVRAKVFGLDHICSQQTLNNQSLVYELLDFDKTRNDGTKTTNNTESDVVAATVSGGVDVDAQVLERKGVSDMLSGQQLDEALKQASDCLHEIPDHQDKGEYSDAIRICHKALSVIRNSRHNGVNQLAYAVALNELGVVYEDEELYSQAELTFSHTLRILFYVYGDLPHSNIATALTNLGNAFRFQGKYSAALTTFRQAKEMWQSLKKDSLTPEVNSVEYSIAQCSLCLKRLKDAFDTADSVLINRITMYGAESVEVSSAHNLIGIIHAGEGRLDDALRSFEMAGKVREGILGRQHISSATVSGNLSLVYILLQDLAKAGVIISQSLELRDRQIGPVNADVEVALLNFSSIFKAQNNKDVVRSLEQGVKSIRRASALKRAKITLHLPDPVCPCDHCWDDSIRRY